jgi:uncharacterized membrane protein YphA (DoxX/SURF4 family)
MTRLKNLLPVVVRVLMSGLFMFSVMMSVTGGKLPVPPGSGAEAFARAMTATGYLIPLLKAMELVGALLLLRKRFVPLALVMLAPIVVNIMAFHVFLERGGLPIAAFLAAGMVYLGIMHAAAFRPLLGRREPRLSA